LSAAGIEDAGANLLAGDLASDFTVDTVAPTVTITPVSPNPRNSAVDSMTITFSKPVSGFSMSDLQLSDNGAANLLGGTQTLTSADNLTWTLGNLAGLTAGSGTYTLTLLPGGIQDAVGNALASGATSSFTLHTWQNTANPLDVDNSGIVTPLDALAVINYIDLNQASILPLTFSGVDYLDVNGDDVVSPLDALAVINYINEQLSGKSGPSVESAVSSGAVPSGAMSSSVAGSPGLAGSPEVTELLAPLKQAPMADSAGAAVTWAVSAGLANHPAAASLVAASPAASAPQVATQTGSPGSATAATGSGGLNQAAVDWCFAGGVRRSTNSNVQASAADIVLARLPSWPT
jgi:hypothetical protein